jgi:hypothetical protein
MLKQGVRKNVICYIRPVVGWYNLGININEKLKGVVKKDKKIEYSKYKNPSCEAIFQCHEEKDSIFYTSCIYEILNLNINNFYIFYDIQFDISLISYVVYQSLSNITAFL